MLTLERVRSLLSHHGDGMSDAEIEALRDHMYVVADVMVGAHLSGSIERTPRLRKTDFDTALNLIPQDDHDEVRERAAILEFDAGVGRDQAERDALQRYVTDGLPATTKLNVIPLRRQP